MLDIVRIAVAGPAQEVEIIKGRCRNLAKSKSLLLHYGEVDSFVGAKASISKSQLSAKGKLRLVAGPPPGFTIGLEEGIDPMLRLIQRKEKEGDFS